VLSCRIRWFPHFFPAGSCRIRVREPLTWVSSKRLSVNKREQVLWIFAIQWTHFTKSMYLFWI
jgi:hypothetical protein